MDCLPCITRRHRQTPYIHIHRRQSTWIVPCLIVYITDEIWRFQRVLRHILFNMSSRVATRGGYILVNNSSVVNFILAKANHFLPRSFFLHLISQIATSSFPPHRSRLQIAILKILPLLSMSAFFAILYITILTIRPGTTMTFLGALPARYLAVSSCARTSFSTSSFGVSFGHSNVKRTFPLN